MPTPHNPISRYTLRYIEAIQFGPARTASALLFEIARVVRNAERNDVPAFLVTLDVRQDEDTDWSAILYLERDFDE